MNRALRALQLAFGLLTVLPVGGGEATDAELADSRYAFPIVGLVLGVALLLLSDALARGSAAPLVAAFLLLAVGEAVSGALHLDGLADTFDGLFLSGDAERRLAAMRDPHLGTFGASALALVLLGKFAALASLPGQQRGLAVLAAVAIGRTLILICAGLAKYARPDGTGRVVVESTTWEVASAAAVGAGVIGLATARIPGLIAAGLAAALAWAVARIASTRLGGITGDILGALVELGELTVLVALSLLQPIGAK